MGFFVEVIMFVSWVLAPVRNSAMSLIEFENAVNRSRFGKLEKKWFPVWLKRNAEFLKATPDKR